jgi:hypothetical protein
MIRDILLALVVLTLVGGGAACDRGNAFEQARIGQARLTIARLKNAIVEYAVTHQTCPRDLQVLVAERHIQSLPRDPWGERLVYRCPGANDKDGGDVSSKGPDRTLGTRDDINSWEMR